MESFEDRDIRGKAMATADRSSDHVVNVAVDSIVVGTELQRYETVKRGIRVLYVRVSVL